MLVAYAHSLPFFWLGEARKSVFDMLVIRCLLHQIFNAAPVAQSRILSTSTDTAYWRQ